MTEKEAKKLSGVLGIPVDGLFGIDYAVRKNGFRDLPAYIQACLAIATMRDFKPGTEEFKKTLFGANEQYWKNLAEEN